MTFAFGTSSQAKLKTCHPKIIQVANAAILATPADFTIVWGFRPETIQNALFDSGASKKRFPNSKHNFMSNSVKMSKAIDFAPWIHGSIPWKDTHAFAVLAGVFFAVAGDIKLRWGGDFDGDGLTVDQTFLDYGHMELA